MLDSETKMLIKEISRGIALQYPQNSIVDQYPNARL